MINGARGRLAGVCVVAAALGCDPKASYHAPPALTPADAATLRVRGKLNPFEPAFKPVAVLQIDGKKGPDGPGYGGKWGDLLLTTGPHQLRVAYDDGQKFSVNSADLTFSAEPGRIYEVVEWPPVLTDVTDGKIRRAVKHQLTVVNGR